MVRAHNDDVLIVSRLEDATHHSIDCTRDSRIYRLGDFELNRRKYLVGTQETFVT